jgi:hypothetical protein
MDLEQIVRDYERDGVVRIRGFWSAAKVNAVRQALERFCRDIVPALPTSDRIWEADGQSLRNLFRMEQHDPYFLELGLDPEIMRMMGQLLHGEPELSGVETFNKPARVGSAIPPHQDNAYFCQTPPDMLTLWIALDPATVENGAVYYIRGSHRHLLPHRPSGVVGNSMGLVDPPAPGGPDEFCGTLEPGDALIHNCQTIHRSEPNTTDQPRCGFLMVYRGTHTRTDEELQNDYEKTRTAMVIP